MFKHFGYRDVFAGLRRYRLTLLIVAIVSILIGCVIGISKVQSQEAITQEHPAQYVNTSTFLINPENENPTQKESKNYYAVLRSDYCCSLVFDELVERFGEEELKNRLQHDMESNGITKLDPDILLEMAEIEQVTDSYVVTVKATSYDKEVADAIIDGYTNYANNTLTEEFVPGTVTFLGTIHRAIEEEDVDGNGSLKTLLVSVAKKCILYGGVMFVAGMAICLIVLFILLLVAPTLNRRTDYMKYGLPVLGELTCPKKDQQ